MAGQVVENGLRDISVQQIPIQLDVPEKPSTGIENVVAMKDLDVRPLFVRRRLVLLAVTIAVSVSCESPSDETGRTGAVRWLPQTSEGFQGSKRRVDIWVRSRIVCIPGDEVAELDTIIVSYTCRLPDEDGGYGFPNLRVCILRARHAFWIFQEHI